MLDIIIVLGLLALVMVLFALEFISVDVITLGVLSILVLTGILTVEEAFRSFGSELVIILVSIFVFSGSLQQTGVLHNVGYLLYKHSRRKPKRLLAVLMSIVGGISAFMNNTTVTAAFIPVTSEISRRAKISPSQLFIPLAFASILGGTCTLIGTSTNVAVSGYIKQYGLEPIHLFEFTPVGVVILIIGILYMTFFGKQLLPKYKEKPLSEILPEYLCEVLVIPDSHLINQKISDSDLAKLDFRILAIQRGKKKFMTSGKNRIKQGDILYVQSTQDELMKIKETAGIEIKPDVQFNDFDLQDSEIKVAEALITPKSYLVGRTMKSADFRRRYGIVAIGIYRQGHSLSQKVGSVKLRIGDLLLVQGPSERMEYLRRNEDFWILEDQVPRLYRKRKGIVTVAVFLAAIGLAGFGFIPLSIGLLTAAVIITLLRCITPEEAYNFVEWRMIILIAGMSAFGIAMQKSGAAALISKLVVSGLEPFGVMAILAGFFVLTILLTQPMSNAAAALVVLPVALQTADTLGVNERTFAIAIMLAASISLIAPLEPASILVYGPGKYKFRDFIKAGAPLTLVLAIVVLALIPVFWPLSP